MAAPATAPGPLSGNPLVRMADDLWGEWRGRGAFPPGPVDFDFRRTLRFGHDPLPMLLRWYEDYGPVFSVRLFHMRTVFMLGPAANHYVTVSHAGNFRWREGRFGDLAMLLGDGLLTIDGDYHDRARRIMMPAFHSRRVAAAVDTMVEEATAALGRWREGQVVDVYEWMRNLAMRIAMRVLLGLDPDDAGSGARAAHHFERALEYYGTTAPGRVARGPGTAYSRMLASRRVLDEIVYAEIAERRRSADPDRGDVLGLLLDARDERDGTRLSDREVRDQLMTLLFAGHDTSTSTLSFLVHELAGHPNELAALTAEQDEVLRGAAPAAEQVAAGLPRLDMALDETLRLYPPAWIGPRRSVDPFEFEGIHVPGGAHVNYCSWASHRLPEVFPDPETFRPERFERDRKAALPKGAYVPFGGGSRICIGKRFGQMEVKAVATVLLQRFRLERLPGHTMTVRQMPTLSPREGLPMVVRAR